MTRYCRDDCRRCKYVAGLLWLDTRAAYTCQPLNFCPSCGRRLDPKGTAHKQIDAAVALRALACTEQDCTGCPATVQCMEQGENMTPEKCAEARLAWAEQAEREAGHGHDAG